ncbi:MAG: Hpt domain-containing protein [Sulfuricurvum sp.]
MLFYNHNQEFIGVDDEGLKLLNYGSLQDLLSICGDVADLFAPEPGYIYNFKNFGWIDFLLHSDSDTKSAIVHANGRVFSCILEVHKLYLCDNPFQNGYIVEMSRIQTLSGDEIKPHTIAPSKPRKEPLPRYETPVASPPPASPQIVETHPVEETILPDYGHIEPTLLKEPGTFDIPDYSEPEPLVVPESTPVPEVTKTFEIPDVELEEIFKRSEPEEVKSAIPVPSSGSRYTPEEQEFIDHLQVPATYRFDPNIAANELGLPVDLIQEFIGDFIQQSYDFKSELFEALLKGDMNNLKILSHKLKGVAANLRIEDAFETLATVNTSNDTIEVEANLKHFYTIIEKLEGKEPSSATVQSTFSDSSDDIMVLEPRQTEPSKPSLLPIKEESDEDIYAFMPKTNETTFPTFDNVTEEIVLDDFMPEAMPTIETHEEIEEATVNTSDDNEIASDISIHQIQYDKVRVAGSLGIDVAFLDDLIADYKNDALNSARGITNAVNAFDTHSWKNTAKQLKGISDHLRLNEISEELAILSETNDAQEANKASKRLNGYLDQL